MNPTYDRYDVIVVGGRVAGATTALVLARRGFHVLVVERARRGTDTRSTHALMKTGVFLLGRLGLLDALLAAGTPPITSTTFHYGDESVVIPQQPSPEVPCLLAPRRTVLDPTLSDAATVAGAEVCFATSVDDIVRDESGRVTGVVGRSEEGVPFVASAPLVIGADGVRSIVARRVDAPVVVRGHHASAVIHAYFGPTTTAPVDELTGYEWSYRPGASAGLIPTNDGVLVWVGMPPARFEAEGRRDVEHAFGQVLRAAGPEVAERLAGAERTSRFHTYAGVPGFVRRGSGPGWALVGDASHLTDPLSAHGITDALRDASSLASAAAIGLRDPAAMAGAMADHGERRDRLSLPLLRATDRLASYAWDSDEVRVVLRDMSAAMKAEYRATSAGTSTDTRPQPEGALP